MVYVLTVEPAHLREQTIADHVSAADAKTEPFYDFQNRQHDLKVITIPIGLPVYRMANYRTRIAQQAYIRREGLPPTIFPQVRKTKPHKSSNTSFSKNTRGKAAPDLSRRSSRC